MRLERDREEIVIDWVGATMTITKDADETECEEYKICADIVSKMWCK